MNAETMLSLVRTNSIPHNGARPSGWRLGVACGLLVCAQFLGGCASTPVPIPIHVLARSPEFSYEQLVRDGVDVAGVVFRVPQESVDAAPTSEAPDPTALDTEPDQTLAQSDHYVSMLRRQLRSAELPLGEWGEPRRSFGDELMLASLESIRVDGSLSPEIQASIAEAMGDEARFIVFVRIEDVSSHTGSYSRDRPDNFTEGKWESGGSTTTSYAERTVVASFSIHHPAKPDRLLHAELESGAANSQQREDFASDSLFVELLADLIISEPDPPSPPSVERAVASVFDDFVTALREQADKEQEENLSETPE